MSTRLASRPTLPLHSMQLLLQVGALEVLARLAQRQRQQIVLDQRFVGRRLRRQLALDFLESDLLRARVQQEAARQIAQFTHIVGPRIVAQPILRGDAEAPEAQSLALGQRIDVVPQQLGHVLGVVAQCRHAHQQHRQLRIQVAAEFLGHDAADDAGTRRGDDAGFERHRLAAADAREAAALEHAAEQALRRGGQILDVAEEQRALAGLLEQPGRGLVRGPTAWRRGVIAQRAAVDRDERATGGGPA